MAGGDGGQERAVASGVEGAGREGSWLKSRLGGVFSASELVISD